MSNLAEKLDEYLDEQSGAAEVQGFVIDDIDKADWAVRKISFYQQRIDDAKALADTRIQQINAWLDKETQDNIKQIAFFESVLRPFADAQLLGSKKRSFNLPSGTIGFRKAGIKFQIDGEPVSGKSDKLTKWVKENQKDYLVVKEETDWGEFKKTLRVHEGKAITADGETIPGVTADIPPDSFYVKGAEK
jgi:hypothetical protein